VTVELRAVVQDITAVNPAMDANPGNISRATVTFVNRDTGVTITDGVSIQLWGGDPTTGIATFLWSVNLGTQDAISFTIGFIVDGYYTRNDSQDDTIVTVAKPVEGSITGGGYLINEFSAGPFAGAAGLKTNFGFNVKVNKQRTNLQGHVNIIIRQEDHVYQIKTNAMESLLINKTVGTATFVSKANLIDITDPYNPVSIAGNLKLIITVTDGRAPGVSDSIGITLWRGSDLWYSSYWIDTKTKEDFLDGGNLVIH